MLGKIGKGQNTDSSPFWKVNSNLFSATTHAHEGGSKISQSLNIVGGLVPVGRLPGNTATQLRAGDFGAGQF